MIFLLIIMLLMLIIMLIIMLLSSFYIFALLNMAILGIPCGL